MQNFSGVVKLDLTKLEAIQRELGKKYYVKVGVLGDSAKSKKPRKEAITTKRGVRKMGKERADQTNAEVGFTHEFGSISKRIPQRSFLRVPLWLKFPSVLQKVGQQVIDGLTKDNILQAYKGLGIMAENIIQVAFATRGYGRWSPNAPRTIAEKKSDRPLIDTAQLRKSITSKVYSS